MTAPEFLELAVDNVHKRFAAHGTTFTALDGITTAFRSTEMVGIVGESGSGKSTLARILVGLETPSAGRVMSNGRPVLELLRSPASRLQFRRDVQFVAQDSTSSFDPSRSLRDALRLPVMTLHGVATAEADLRIDHLLDLLELPSHSVDRMPFEVSGGQRQRMSIVRALVVRPRLLICDEAVSALDVSVQGSVLNAIKDYCEEERSGLVFVSHGLPATAFVADRIIVMRSGRIVDDGSTEHILDGSRHSYTRTLLAAHRGGSSAVRTDLVEESA